MQTKTEAKCKLHGNAHTLQEIVSPLLNYVCPHRVAPNQEARRDVAWGSALFCHVDGRRLNPPTVLLRARKSLATQPGICELTALRFCGFSRRFSPGCPWARRRAATTRQATAECCRGWLIGWVGWLRTVSAPRTRIIAGANDPSVASVLARNTPYSVLLHT